MPTRTTIDAKLLELQEHLATQDEQILAEFQERLDMSWIYHDSSLEGVVLSFHELKSAIDKDVVSDVSLIPTYDEIRAHKAAIDFVREQAAQKKKVPVTLELLLKIRDVLSPENSEILAREEPWRKDTPVHRLYFHDIPSADKIPGEMKKLGDWLIDPETKKLAPLRMAAKLHFKLMQIYPFPKHSGKHARLAMNLILLRSAIHRPSFTRPSASVTTNHSEARAHSCTTSCSIRWKTRSIVRSRCLPRLAPVAKPSPRFLLGPPWGMASLSETPSF